MTDRELENLWHETKMLVGDDPVKRAVYLAHIVENQAHKEMRHACAESVKAVRVKNGVVSQQSVLQAIMNTDMNTEVKPK